MNNLRSIPSVDLVLHDPDVLTLTDKYGKSLIISLIRESLEDIRTEKNQVNNNKLDLIKSRLSQKLINVTSSSLRPVINATGVILHTNLGRSTLSTSSINAMQHIASSYSTLEYDLNDGTRGLRSDHARDLLVRLTGAEDAFVVNNNAAAVLLCLTALANRKTVIIPRSQLIEIGGGFRIPDVMKQSGAKLKEIGTTNRVHLSDYEEALAEGASIVMRAHSSNFKIVGFTEQPSIKEIIELSHSHGSIFVDDLGSGSLLDTSRFGLTREPMVQDSIAAGADLVCFSGDKLLGGPQAGIIVGNKQLLAKIRKHPLARAVRIDKLCLAALAATLLHYLKAEAEQEIPVWKMISMDTLSIKPRAVHWLSEIGTGEVISGVSTIGGGSLPEETLPTWLYSIKSKNPDQFLKTLRKAAVPIISRIQNDRILFDPRTVLLNQDSELIATIKKTLQRSDP
jgi:L-seryl-tRNA(Ser) seleniumtransferase